MNQEQEERGGTAVSSKAKEMMAFVENSSEFLPKGSFENITVIEREDVNDTLIFLHELEVHPHEGLWDAMLRLYPSPSHSQTKNNSSQSGNLLEIKELKAYSGEKRNISAISTEHELGTMCCKPSSVTISPENNHLHSSKRPYFSSGIDETTFTSDSTPTTNQKAITFEYEENINNDKTVEKVPQIFVPKSILKTRTSVKKCRVVFHDTVTLVTHSYSIISGGSEFQLNQVEENINRLAYENKETPVQVPADRTRRRINFDDEHSPNVEAPVESLTSFWSDMNKNNISENNESVVNEDEVNEESYRSSDKVKKVLFPPVDDTIQGNNSSFNNQHIFSNILENQALLLEDSLKDDMITFSDDYVKEAKDTLATNVSDSSSYHSSFITSVEDTETSLSVDASSSMMVLYSQDLESNTPPMYTNPNVISSSVSSHNYGSYNSTSVTPISSTFQSCAHHFTSTISPSSSFHYQSFSQPSQDTAPLPPSNVQLQPELREINLPAAADENFNGENLNTESTKDILNVSDPLQLSQWPSVIWTRTKSYLPAPYLIRTKPPGVVVYLIQKNMRFEDNLALQAAMVASQTLQLPLVVWALLERDVIEDVKEMGRISRSFSQKLAVVTPQTPTHTTPANDQLCHVVPEKLALLQKSVTKLTALRDLQRSLSAHHIPLLVYDYPTLLSTNDTNSNISNFTPQTPKSLAMHHLFSSYSGSSTSTDNQNSQGRYDISVLFTDDFSHPYTVQWISIISQAQPHLPIFCVDSSSLVSPNLQIPLLDASMVLHQQQQSLHTKTPHKTLSDWAMSQETYNDHLLQAQCDYQDRLFTLQEETQWLQDNGQLSFLPNDWQLVSENKSKWTYTAQAQLQKEFLYQNDQKLPLFPAAVETTCDNICFVKNWLEMLDSIVPSISFSSVPSTAFKTKIIHHLVTPAAKHSNCSYYAHDQTSILNMQNFSHSMVRAHWTQLQETLNFLQENMHNDQQLQCQTEISDSSIQYLILSYHMGLFSPQNILALNHYISSLTSSLPPVVRAKHQIKQLVQECMVWDYAQLILYDSRQLQCVVNPVSGASLPWMQVLPLETLTFLFKDCFPHQQQHQALNHQNRQAQVVLSELRHKWRKYCADSSLAWASLTPTQSISDSLGILNFSFLSLHGNTKKNEENRRVILSRGQIQWWLLVCLLQAPAVSGGVNLAFRAFALYFTVSHAEDCLSPAMFLLALMELPGKLQKLVEVNPWVFDENLLTSKMNVSEIKDRDYTEGERFWNCLQETFYSVVS